MKELKNELFKEIKIILTIIFTSCSTIYSKATLCHFSWDFPLYNSHVDTKYPLIRKQMICFDVYISRCYFHSYSYSQLRYKTTIYQKQLQKSFIHSLKIIDLKFKQNLWKINVKVFLLCSVASTTPIFWNTLSYSKKLFQLRQTYPRLTLLIKINIIHFSY